MSKFVEICGKWVNPDHVVAVEMGYDGKYVRALLINEMHLDVHGLTLDEAASILNRNSDER